MRKKAAAVPASLAAYKLHYLGCVIRTRDGAFIPPDTGNGDYAAYLAWVAIGNTPDPADPAPPPSPGEVADNNDLAAFPTRTQITNAIGTINTDLTTLGGAPTNAQVVAIVVRHLQRELYEINGIKSLVKRGAP